jgi:hypothetical protein
MALHSGGYCQFRNPAPPSAQWVSSPPLLESTGQSDWDGESQFGTLRYYDLVEVERAGRIRQYIARSRSSVAANELRTVDQVNRVCRREVHDVAHALTAYDVVSDSHVRDHDLIETGIVSEFRLRRHFRAIDREDACRGMRGRSINRG